MLDQKMINLNIYFKSFLKIFQIRKNLVIYIKSWILLWYLYHLFSLHYDILQN